MLRLQAESAERFGFRQFARAFDLDVADGDPSPLEDREGHVCVVADGRCYLGIDGRQQESIAMAKLENAIDGIL